MALVFAYRGFRGRGQVCGMTARGTAHLSESLVLRAHVQVKLYTTGFQGLDFCALKLQPSDHTAFAREE